jgi:hypothetical protein
MSQRVNKLIRKLNTNAPRAIEQALKRAYKRSPWPIKAKLVEQYKRIIATPPPEKTR